MADVEGRAVGVLRAAMSSAFEGGMSLRELSRRSKVDVATVSKFYRGKRDLAFSGAARLAEALGLVLMPAKAKAKKRGA
jgi:plasmid maintenance system antidote protein VapI